MFKVVYPSAKDFFSFISSVAKVSDIVTLNLTEDGVFSRHLTEDKTLMALAKIPKDVLSDYSIEKPLSVKLDITSVKKVLSKAKSKKATIEIDETESGIKIVIKDEKSGTKSNIYLKVEKGDVEQINEPKVSLSASFTTDDKVLDIIAGDLSLIGEEMKISAYEDRVEMEVEEQGKKYISILTKDKSLKDISVESSASASYSVEMFKNAVAALRGFSAPITVSFGNNLPIKLSVNVPSGGQMTFWIAPRV